MAAPWQRLPPAQALEGMMRLQRVQQRGRIDTIGTARAPYSPMSTTVSKLPTRRPPSQCIGVAFFDEGQALVLRPVAAEDPDATAEEDLPWLVHRHAKPIVVDLSTVEHFNSDFARWLLNLANLLPSHRLHLRNASRSVRAGMRLLGFDRLVDPGQ